MSTLQKFFFDVVGFGESYADEYGVELASIEDARAEAFGLAAALMRDKPDFGGRWEATITVRNADRQPVYRCECTVAGHDLEKHISK